MATFLSLSAYLLAGTSFGSGLGAKDSLLFSPLEIPMRHGVVFFCPEEPQRAIEELEKLKADGFRLIEFASWLWTIPAPGSDVERRAQAVLDWCDRNDVGFFLIHNIQYGSPGEAGGLNKEVLNPDEAVPFLLDWVRVLGGHRCVLGVILGNEVGPHLGTPEDAPALWGEFREWLRGQHGAISALNSAWRTAYNDFTDIGPPPEGSLGWVDYRRFARKVFARFYGHLFARGIRPALGPKLYGNKTSLDPFLHRACTEMTMVCWDDMVAQHPLWRIKCAADTSPKPLFNSELHLYNDDFQYFPSVERSRYRYFTSALLGEYLTASYAWGNWSKPEIAAIHAATPKTLADLARVEKWCRLLAAENRRAQVGVLVTESNYYVPPGMVEADYEKRHPLGLLYAYLGASGVPWRYVLEDDLGTFRAGTLVVWSEGLRPETARALVRLPGAVRIFSVGQPPERDEYGRPLEQKLALAVAKRCKMVTLRGLQEALEGKGKLPAEYSRVGHVRYWWWSPQRGHYVYDVPTCLLEARRASAGQGMVVAVVNHTEEKRAAPLPWVRGTRVKDLVSERWLAAGEVERQEFEPLAVRLFLYNRR